MSRPGTRGYKHYPQYTTLIETADAESMEWWRSLTPRERGQVISAVAPQPKKLEREKNTEQIDNA